jgi:DNA (cytosine-5)-methyltransferase 1
LPEGYRVDAFTVNAVNHGAPQARERLLLFGNRLGRAASFPSPTHGKPPLVPFRTLGEALEGLDREGDGVLDFSPRKKGFLAMVPPGGNWRSLPDAVAREAMGRAYFRNGGRSAFWRRLSHDLPAPTIMAMPNHISTALCHPTETRALSLKECARLQEFPDGWAFAGTLAQRYAQVGNAVPVRLARLAAGVLAEILDGTAPPAGGLPRFRLGYVQSHVRTRRWFKDGQAVVRETPA